MELKKKKRRREEKVIIWLWVCCKDLCQFQLILVPLLDRQERCQVKLQYKGLKRDVDDTTVGTKRRNLAGDVN